MSYGIDGIIQDKVDAYRGQPQRLMQQYAQNQQLIDLLALQKLKTEKESAARQLQLQMARQAGKPTTIADQRQQEVMELTRNEVAQGAPQGIEAAPAPNMQFAGGGIVAFAGDEGSYVGPMERAKASGEKVRGEQGSRARANLQALLEKLGIYSGDRYDALEAAEKVSNIPAPEDVWAAATGMPEGMVTAATPTTTSPDTAPAEGAAPAASTTSTSTTAAPQAGGIAIADPSDFSKSVQSRASELMGIDSEAARRARAAEWSKDVARSPEELAGLAAIRKEQEALQRELNDPNELLMRRLVALGGGFRNGIGGAGEAFRAERDRQDASRQAGLEKIAALREAQQALEQQQRAGAFTAGTDAEQVAADQMRTGLTAGAQLAGDETQRAVAQAQIDQRAQEAAIDAQTRTTLASIAQNKPVDPLEVLKLVSQLQKDLAGIEKDVAEPWALQLQNAQQRFMNPETEEDKQRALQEIQYIGTKIREGRDARAGVIPSAILQLTDPQTAADLALYGAE